MSLRSGRDDSSFQVADLMREAAALALALAAAAMVDRLAARRGLDPPGFRDPGRRLIAGLGLAFIFFLGIFHPALTFDRQIELDLEAVSPLQLFFSQLLLVVWLGLWWRLGFGHQDPPRWRDPALSEGVAADGGGGEGRARSLAGELGLSARDVGKELSIGLAAGLVGWLAVLSAALLAGLVVTEIGGEGLLSREPAEQIVWLASLPIGLRLAVSLAAGTVEELFFRGFLQPRVGIVASTVLFAGAHLAYGDLFMLFGVSLLSLFYAGLVVWRRSVWAAMAAHFLFDAVQLLVIIPAVLRVLGQDSGP